MALSAWPVADVPYKMNQQGYTNVRVDGRIASSTEVGPGKVRLRTSATVRRVSGAIEMNSAELVAFRNFYEVTCRFGTFPFTVPDQVGGAIVEARFAIDAPPPQESALGPFSWTVMVALEYLPT